jgi:hypothetical protein
MINTEGRKCAVRLLFFASVIIFFHQTAYSQKTVSCGANKVLICHKGKNTLCISENALKAHLDHGDYMGSCIDNACSVSTSGGIITCKDTTVTLITSSSISSGSYAWSGPDDFASTLQMPITKKPGTYIVTVTDNTSGCIASDTAIVYLNELKPVITAIGGKITCANTSVTLISSSSISSVTYKWEGPNGFSSLLKTPIVSDSGLYRLTVTNPANDCSSKDSVKISQDKNLPDVTASVPDSLTCARSLINITANSSIPRVNFIWTGPSHFYSTERNPFVVLAGKYIVTATNPVNGCASTNSVMVAIDTIKPDRVRASVSNALTCTMNSVTLYGFSNTRNVNYSWRGPNGFGTNEQNPTINDPGLYALMVINPANGCASNDSVTVQQDTITPKGVTATASNMINCNYSSATLIGTSTTSGVNYYWSGPGLSSTLPSPLVTRSGTYFLIVTNPVNGCITTRFVSVTSTGCPNSTVESKKVLPIFTYYSLLIK